jgi:putative membrane-bound dehydrogenase-like protein
MINQRMRTLWIGLVALGGLCAPELMGEGRQLTGPHAPAASIPLTPEEAAKSFTVPEGFEVRLFASEPMVINPVAMTWDERGRLWVVELFEYPMGAKPGEKPRDQIKILEDTDRDGRADKVTVFADGLNLATGILVGHGGVFVGQAPYLFYYQDTDGDDVADKREVVLEGFGLQDRHELLNGFTWGPDGYLYMTHGVFTHSKVKNPEDPEDDGMIMNAAVARVDPRTRSFEIFSDGTSNPWGVDFDRKGNAFLSACVIDHMFHMAPGGLYDRQGGAPEYPYSYELLPSIVDHKHYRAAYAGVQVYQGDQYPESYQGAIFMGNIHANAVHQDHLEPVGSSFVSKAEQDFMVSSDGWFRPVSEQTGPDGALWVMDWYDKYPCYQNANADPEGVDREYGRIWRVVYVGDEAGKDIPPHPAGMDLKTASTEDLIGLLNHNNSWMRRTAQRVLSERQEESSRVALESLVRTGDKKLETRLAALWTLHGAGLLRSRLLDDLVNDRDPALRAWCARLTGERRKPWDGSMDRLYSLAYDVDPTVRAAVAVATRQFASGALTVNRPLPDELANAQLDLGPLLVALVENTKNPEDRFLPFMIWMAAEPSVSKDPFPALSWMENAGSDSKPLSLTITRKIARRICDTQDLRMVEMLTDFVIRFANRDVDLVIAALDGLLDGQRSKVLKPEDDWDSTPFYSRLLDTRNPAVVERTLRLGALWGDPKAIQTTLKLATNTEAGASERSQAIRIASQFNSEVAVKPLLEALQKSNDASADLQIELVRTLTKLGGSETPHYLVAHWNKASSAVRQAIADSLISRNDWTERLLVAVEDGLVKSGEIPVTTIRALSRNENESIQTRARDVIGRIRDPNVSKLQLILDKRKIALEGEPDLAAGRKVAENTCFVCHKFYGAGYNVGPDLTGVGRSSLNALLANIIDPNQVIGRGYENVEIETDLGQFASGRMIEDTPTRVTLLSAGDNRQTFDREDIASIKVTDISVMPEGLEQMPAEDFRNLLWYILNPPEENRPMTPALRSELVGEAPLMGEAVETKSNVDWESVSLWNPEWKVESAESRDAPAKLVEWKGRNNVLKTYPYWHQRGAAIMRDMEIASEGSTWLEIEVAAHEGDEWMLRVFADLKMIRRQKIDSTGETWTTVRIDLTQFAGRTIPVRLENYAYNWDDETGYWASIKVIHQP